MKQTTLVSILLIVLTVFSWISVIGSMNNDNTYSMYQEYMDKAQICVDRGLYERAVLEYNSAIDLMPNKEAYDKKMSVWEKIYEEDNNTYYDYINELKAVVNLFPEDTSYLLKLTEVYKSQSMYKEAYKLLNKAVSNGMEDVNVDEQLIKVKYAYVIDERKWTDVSYCINGRYVVQSEGKYYYMNEQGNVIYDNKYVYAGPIGDDGIVVLSDENGNRIVNGNKVLMGRLSFTPEESGVFSEELVAVSDGSGFTYYDSYGDPQFGSFSYAGTFKNGRAAVMKDRIWYIIDNTGNKVSDDTFDMIYTMQDGTFEKDGIMLAKKDNKCSIFKDGQIVCSYDDIDTVVDGAIAIKVGGKWGYADLSGEEIISPQFFAARSFSYGLAAVNNGSQWGFINTYGQLVIDYTFSDVGYFNSEGYCPVQNEDGTWQFIHLINFG